MLVSVAARNASLAMSYGDDRGSEAPDSLEVALFAGDPAGTGAEVTGGGYARAVVDNDGSTWGAPSGGAVTSVPISFAASGGAWSDVATHYQLFDAVTGDEWDSGLLADPISVTAAAVVARVEVTVFYEEFS